jgi:hypothetical protein
LAPGLSDEGCSSEAEGLVAAPDGWIIEVFLPVEVLAVLEADEAATACPPGEVLVFVGEDAGDTLSAFWLR